MEKNSKIFVAGSNGLAGSAIVRKLSNEGYYNLLVPSSNELDLRINEKVLSFFIKEQPEYVFFAAGTVGGIMANRTYPADFISNNISIILNTLQASLQTGVKKLLYLGSSCIYPKYSEQPIKEEYLLSGFLEESNRPYAIAKIAGIELCQSFNKQFNTDYICLMPTNLFGIKDNYDSQNSHLVAALIRKFYEAKLQGNKIVEIWGTGSPKREILCSDELADASLYFMNTYSGNDIINIGSGVDYTISEIASFIKDISGFDGEIKYDLSKPNGTPRKLLDSSRAELLGWKSKSDLLNDLFKAFDDFDKNFQLYIKK